MLSTHLLALTLVVAPSLVSAALFPKDSLVKMLDAKGFKKAMKVNETSVVAFVAPWCGHCQRLVPEYSKAALGLYPLVPAYAIDCDAEKNKRLCAEQGIKGFPTLKMFPRGSSLPPMDYTGDERTASAIWYWVTRRIPMSVTKFFRVHEIYPWLNEHKDKNRALLLTKDKKIPLLWKVLGNKYKGTTLEFGTHRDKKGKSSVEMGFEAGGKKESKVLLYPAGSTTPVRYDGILKLDSLTKFFDSVLDGTADLSKVVEELREEDSKFVPDPKELEIEKKQEAQRIALMHGGFTDLIDFEKAMLKEGGADFHDNNGYGGMMGGIPEHLKKKPEEPLDKPVTPTPSAELTATPTGHAATAVPKTEEPAKAAEPEVKEAVPVVVEDEKDGFVEDAPEQIVMQVGKEGSASAAGHCSGKPASGLETEESSGCGCAGKKSELKAEDGASCGCGGGASCGCGASCSCGAKAAAERPKDEL
ncbi:hypothetical protein B0H34DRAFT_841823 [Crassisporium funariophilum]|nr:hypothetical protein B0H34DRAFT_841823 [Crassisporium funariophilum]